MNLTIHDTKEFTIQNISSLIHNLYLDSTTMFSVWRIKSATFLKMRISKIHLIPPAKSLTSHEIYLEKKQVQPKAQGETRYRFIWQIIEMRDFIHEKAGSENNIPTIINKY